MSGEGPSGVDELPGRLAAGALLLIALFAAGSWLHEGFNRVDFAAMLEQGGDAAVGQEPVIGSELSCLRNSSRQLDALLALKRRQRYESLGAAIGGQPELQSQLISARHALEEARLNYAHAKDNVRLGCHSNAALPVSR